MENQLGAVADLTVFAGGVAACDETTKPVTR